MLIAAFMVAIFLGPRRWMAWAAQLRERVRLIRAALRARRDPPRDTDEALRDTDEAPWDTDEPPLRD